MADEPQKGLEAQAQPPGQFAVDTTHLSTAYANFVASRAPRKSWCSISANQVGRHRRRLGGPLAGSFGQVALGQGLQPPDQAPDQPNLVAGAGRFAEQFGVLVPELADGQAP